MKNLDEKVNKLASRIQEAFCEWHIHHKTCPTMSNLSICALRLRSNGLCGNLKGWKEPGAIGCGGSSCKYVIFNGCRQCRRPQNRKEDGGRDTRSVALHRKGPSRAEQGPVGLSGVGEGLGMHWDSLTLL